jgi:hypothetical protein
VAPSKDRSRAAAATISLPVRTRGQRTNVLTHPTPLFVLVLTSSLLVFAACTRGGDQSDTTAPEARGDQSDTTPPEARGFDKKSRSVVLVDRPFKCANYPQPLNLNLVKVKLTRSSKSKLQDAVWLSGGDCSGFIRRVEVDTWLADGIKIGRKAHDLTIAGGVIRCHGRVPKSHQDGIHVSGGRRITLRDIEVNCKTSNHSAFYVNKTGANPRTVPTDVICERCTLRATGTTVHIANSERSGVRDSVVYAGRYYDGIRICECAIDPVTEHELVAPQ